MQMKKITAIVLITLFAQSICLSSAFAEATASSSASGSISGSITVGAPEAVTEAAATDTTTDVPAGKEVTIGEAVTAENHEFTVTETYYTTKLSETNGSTTHSYGSDGHYLVVKMSFTNLATESMEQYHSARVSDVLLTYDKKYNYEGEFLILTDDIVPLATANAYLSFPVAETMEADTTKEIIATFRIDGEQYTLTIQADGGSGDEEAGAGEETATSSLVPALKIGDKRTDGSNFEFTFDDLYYATSLSEKNGNTTYKYGSDGYYLILKLSVTNLKAENLEQYHSNRVSDMKLVYNEKYEYEGFFAVLVDDIVPLATSNAYVVFSVPDMLETAEEPLIASFKFDGNEFKVDCRDYEYVTYTDAGTIQKVQEALNAAGFDCGAPDGIAGSGTYGALNAFQEAKGLPVVNAITDEVLNALGISL